MVFESLTVLSPTLSLQIKLTDSECKGMSCVIKEKSDVLLLLLFIRLLP